MSEIGLTLEEVHSLAARVLRQNGCNGDNATAVADVITAAERDGCHSHGLMRLAGYVASLKSGKVNGQADPGVEKIAGAVLRVDGDRGFAPLALARGRKPLIEAAQTSGIAALALTDIHHFAALWTEIEPIAEAGLCALACVSYKPAVIPAGGSKPLYGTNPLAFGWPRANQPPVIFDQASAVMARGEVMLAAREGKQLPPGVGVDKDGRATTDPDEILDGALLAFGGHKGSSIAMMIELFAGALIGECFSFEAALRDNNDGGPPSGGELIIAMDPKLFGDSEGWAAHAEKLFAEIESQPGARLPSARRYRNRVETASAGITLSAKVHESILALCEPAGAA
ncbi:MAG: Ldh family oxidoreductase [Woeseiaceae bacterium]|nr:Ldh family oxidoreductase [Woeseiaceae bacterium]